MFALFARTLTFMPDINQGLLDFLQAAPTPFHTVSELAKLLTSDGFTPLWEQHSWQLESGGKYFVTRNDSSIVAFRLGVKPALEAGMRMVGAHTDSPCLKVKPEPEISKHGYLQLGVEVYGGVLLNPWFDRDLSLAGRITYRDPDNKIGSCLINFVDPIAVIPSLAIHLDREANESRSIDKQKHIVPIMLQIDKKLKLKELLAKQAVKEHAMVNISEVLNFELAFYDVNRPAKIGLKQEFIASARLDNLLSCYVGCLSLIESSGEYTGLLVCNDHEEVGSASAAGAQGPFLKSVLQRIFHNDDEYHRVIAKSVLFSVDNSHGIHPNYSDRHDANHGPILNKGPVIKINANQRYATNSETSAVFQLICNDLNIPYQSFVTRTDLACGSTIGPITASEVGVRTLDIGVPTFAMHSIRELAGSADANYLNKALTGFYDFSGSLTGFS